MRLAGVLVGLLLCASAFGETADNYAPVRYDCDGSDVTFTFAWPVALGTDVVVSLVDNDTNAPTVLTYGSEYTVTGTNGLFDSGGTVTTVTAYSSDYDIVLSRNTPGTQSTTYAGTTVRPYQVRSSLDKLTRIVQELAEKITRCPMVPVSQDGGELPVGSGYVYVSEGGQFGVNAALEGTTLSSYAASILETPTSSSDIRGSLEAARSHEYDVRDYGAVGDGSTDDSTAFQAAHDAAWAAGGGIVRVPASDHCYRAHVLIDDNAAYNNGPHVLWRGDGAFASRIMAVDANTAAITVTGNGAWEWGWSVEDIGFVGGSFESVTERTRSGVEFVDPTPGVANVTFSRCSFNYCDYTYRTVGPLYARFYDCTFNRSNWGPHITSTAGMHGGCQYFINCNAYICYKAGFYTNGGVENVYWMGGANEGHQGFAFYLTGAEDTFPIVIQDCYTENNGGGSNVEIDGHTYADISDTGMRFDGCQRVELRHVKMGGEPDVNDSTVVHYDAYVYGSTTIPLDPNCTNGGRYILRNPYLDLRIAMPPSCEVEGRVTVYDGTSRWACYSTERKTNFVYDHTNLLTGGSMATLSSVANAYTRPYSFVQGDAPHFGRYLSVRLTQSVSYASSFQLFANVSTTQNKWYAASWDIRSDSNDADCNLQWITSFGVSHVYTKADRWLHYNFIQKAPSTQSTADLYLWNPNAAAQTYHLANMQLVGPFNTREEALNFANDGCYVWPVELPRVRATSAALTADYDPVPATDNGKVFTNTGAGGSVTVEMDPATVGQKYTFIRTATNQFIIDPNLTEIFRGKGAGKYLRLDDDAASVTVECFTAGVWDITRAFDPNTTVTGTGAAEDPFKWEP